MEKCIVCKAVSTSYNKQQLPVCSKHKDYEAIELKCPMCKSYLDVRKGKYGTFFSCIECGVLSVHKLKSFSDLFFVKK